MHTKRDSPQKQMQGQLVWASQRILQQESSQVQVPFVQDLPSPRGKKRNNTTFLDEQYPKRHAAGSGGTFANPKLSPAQGLPNDTAPDEAASNVCLGISTQTQLDDHAQTPAIHQGLTAQDFARMHLQLQTVHDLRSNPLFDEARDGLFVNGSGSPFPYFDETRDGSFINISNDPFPRFDEARDGSFINNSSNSFSRFDEARDGSFMDNSSNSFSRFDEARDGSFMDSSGNVFSRFDEARDGSFANNYIDPFILQQN